jgi:predicted RNase H-like HicB family nuclease
MGYWRRKNKLEKELVLLDKGKPTFQGDITKVATEIQTDKRDLFYLINDLFQFYQSKQRQKATISIVFEDVFKNMKMEMIKPIPEALCVSGFPQVVRTISGYDALFLEEEKGYTVVFPKLPGCITQGDTEEEAEKNAREAIDAYLECMAKIGAK